MMNWRVKDFRDECNWGFKKELGGWVKFNEEAFFKFGLVIKSSFGIMSGLEMLPLGPSTLLHSIAILKVN